MLVTLAFLVRELLAVLFLGIVVGTALGPTVDFFARYHVPRVLAGLLLYAALASTIAAFLAYAIPELADEAGELGTRMDELESEYQQRAEDLSLPPWEEFQSMLRERLNGLAGDVASRAGTAATAAIYTLTVFVVGLFWTVSRASAGDLFLSLVSPAHRTRAEELFALLGRRLRHYLLAEVAGMLAIGLLTYVGLTILGVPYAFVLAAISFALEILPILGPWLAFAPALLIALTEGWQTTVLVAVLYLALQQLESYVIVPVFHRQGTGMPELLILMAVLIGSALMGVLGALIALPAAVIIHTVLLEVVVPWRQAQVMKPETPSR